MTLIGGEGKSQRLILGLSSGQMAPRLTLAEMFHVDAAFVTWASLPLPDNYEARGVYVLPGSVSVAGQSFVAGRKLVLWPGDAIALQAGDAGARIMLLGGSTTDGPRDIWWNFVASSKDRIDPARLALFAGAWAVPHARRG